LSYERVISQQKPLILSIALRVVRPSEAMRGEVTVGLLEDHRLVVEALTRMARAAPKLELVWVWPTLAAFLTDDDERGPDVTLVESALLGPDPLNTVRTLARRTRPVVINARPSAPEQVLVLLAGGARGVLLADATRDEILSAIDRVVAERRHLPRTIRALVTDHLTNGREPSYLALSPREREVLRLSVMTGSAQELAEQLFVSPTTVKTHLRRAYRKLGVNNRAGAVRELLRVGALSAPSAAAPGGQPRPERAPTGLVWSPGPKRDRF
jgi:two-component system nitrate/nitrite response regulator NarL